MGKSGTIPIRSYRVCFALERRIHRIDRWRIPVPYGVPLRGIAYAAAALACVLVAQTLPLLGEALRAVHPALRLVIAPVGLAYALCQLRVDGRPAHTAALAWLAYETAPKTLAGFRGGERTGPRQLGNIAIAPDERSARYRPCRVDGPARIILRYPASVTIHGGRLAVRQTSAIPMWRGKTIKVPGGRCLHVR